MTGDSAAKERYRFSAANRLVLFAPNLNGGGAERTLARLATHWADQGRTVTLVTLALASKDDFPLSPHVRRIGLGMTGDRGGLFGGLKANLARISRLRNVMRESQATVVVSFIEQANVLALLAARPLRIPVVISERTDPVRHPVPRLWDWLRTQTYPRCAALVVLTDEIASQFQSLVGKDRVVVVSNGIEPATAPRSHHELPTVVAVGRLDDAKGFDRLIEAFAMISPRHPEWRLIIAGEGSQRSNLAKLIAEKRLSGRIELIGRIVDVSQIIAKADLFALPSRYEGFPNALLEAMAAGLPAVAFDGPSAVRDILRDGIDGILVPEGDITAFAEALTTLMCDSEKRDRMGLAARDVADRFSLATFFERWDTLVNSVASQDFSQLFPAISE